MILHFVELRKGSGPPLLFLHGFLGSSLDWLPVVSYLDNRLCYAIDLPGHGNSPFTEHVRDAFPLFEEPIHLVGYSMGGRLALEYAHHFPQKVSRLTLLSTHPPLIREQDRIEKRAQEALWIQKLGSLPLDLFLEEWYAQPLFGGFRPPLDARRKQNKEALAQSLLHYSAANREPVTAKVDAWVVGERDTKYRKLLPDAQVIGEAAHMVHLENPEQVAKVIR